MTIRINDKFLLFLICFLSANIFVIYFINQEKYIYFWDWAFYQSQYQTLRDLFAIDPVKALETLWYSIRNSDHNFLAVSFLMPFNFHLFGSDRLAYILAIVNIYALPATILFVFLIEKTIADAREKIPFPVKLIIITTTLLMPQFWIPILSGYYDVVGVLVIGAILLLYFQEPLENQKFSHLLLIGLFLSLLILLRRWYAFWVAAFFIAIIIERLIFLFKQFRLSLKHYLASVKNILIIGVTSLCIFFSIATPVAKTMLSTNYADSYSAYKVSDSFFHILVKHYNYFGLLSSLFILFASIICLLSKKTRQVAFFLIIQSITGLLLFSRIQDFSEHHYYLLLPSIIILMSLLAINIVLHSDKKFYQLFFLVIYIVILICNFSIVFNPRASEKLKSFSPLFPKIRHFPLVRHDINEINNMINVLGDSSKNQDNPIYVLSSSGILNDDILKNACLSAKRTNTFCNNILTTSHVDKMDGFPQQFLKAHYVILTNPIQYSLQPKDQRVIGILADEIMNQKGIGLSFGRLNYEFTLDSNVRVYIYEKMKSFKLNDLNNLSQKFIHYYPDKKESFEIHTVCNLIFKKDVGDGFAQVSCYNDFIYLVPGPNKPSMVMFKLNKEFKNVNMKFAFDNADKIPRLCGEKAGEIHLKIISDGKETLRKSINYKQILDYQLDTSNTDILEITADKGNYGPDCDFFMLKDIKVD